MARNWTLPAEKREWHVRWLSERKWLAAVLLSTPPVLAMWTKRWWYARVLLHCDTYSKLLKVEGIEMGKTMKELFVEGIFL